MIFSWCLFPFQGGLIHEPAGGVPLLAEYPRKHGGLRSPWDSLTGFMYQTKGRPALVLVDAGDADVLVARVTTQGYQTPFDVTLLDWQGAGLLAPSVVRLHKLATLEKNLVHRRLGTLQPGDRQRVSDALRRIYGNW